MQQGISVLFGALPTGLVMSLLTITALMSYGAGCLNGAVIVSKYLLRDDVRDHGSGNAGLTNFYRTFGGKLTFLVIAIDMCKTFVAVFLSCVLFSTVLPVVPIFVRVWAGVFCGLGHMYPLMFRFRGGKGILSGGALLFLLDWRVALIAWGLFILLTLLTRLVSLASIFAAATLPFTCGFAYHSPSVAVMMLILTLLIIFQHRGNLLRLLQHKESRFQLRRKRAQS
jgi:glycerol-3-phosphate acyltransferase PlsY